MVLLPRVSVLVLFFPVRIALALRLLSMGRRR
jgi:hypothetical protein